MENLTLINNHSECYLVDSASRRKLFLIYYLAVIIIAIPANVFSLYVSYQHIRQKNDLGVYLFNLALSDLIFTIGLILWLDFLWTGVWAHGGFICLMSVYTLFTNFYTSEVLLCCIAINRYLAVVHPLKYRFLRKVSTAAAVTFGIWVLVIGFNACTITWEESYHPSNIHPMCYDIFLPPSKNMTYANIARFFLGLIIPVVLVFFFTCQTCLAVKSNQATREEERSRILKLLTLVLLCLLVCFGPVHIMMLVRTQLHDCKSFEWFLCTYKISTAISCLNCLVDPLLYCFITKTGQATVKQVLVFFLGKQKSTDESPTSEVQQYSQ